MRAKPSLSRLPLFWECQASEPDTSPIGQPAKFGNALGLLSERFCSGEDCDVVAAAEAEGARDVARLRATWAYVQRYLALGDAYRAEVAFAYDMATDTAREIGQRIKRNYKQHGATDTDVCGSVDLIRVEQGRVIIRDLKSGRGPAAKYRLQLEGYGLVAALAYGVTRADLGVVMCSEHGVDDSYRWEVDLMDMHALRHGLRARLDAMATAEPRGGDWCDSHYCGARKRCPAYWQAKGEVQP